eukprot:90962_1
MMVFATYCRNMFSLVMLSILLHTSTAHLEVYSGNEPTNSISPIFYIRLSQNNVLLSPHVYFAKVNNSRYNCSPAHLEPGWYNRTISWIEFGQTAADITLIEIDIINNYTLFNNTEFPVRILPLSYDISPKISNDYKSISFEVTGNYKSISVEYGNYTVGNIQSNFMNSLLIFVGDLSPIINQSASNVLYFPAGVHNITNSVSNKSILNVNNSIDTIYFARGAYVYGKINDTQTFNGVLNVIGYGILDASYFDYCFRWNNTLDHFSMIESNRTVNLHGLTFYNPSWFITQNQFKANSVIKSFKGIAWYPNNDCTGVGSNGIIEDSFCRTADGQWKIETGSNILLQNNVAWATFNGNIHDMGWFGLGCINCSVRNIDIIHAEFTCGIYIVISTF